MYPSRGGTVTRAWFWRAWRKSGLLGDAILDAGVPGLILGMDGAEPPPADTAVESCGRIAGLIHGRNGLTRPLEVPGFCLIHLLQHIPSSCGQDAQNGIRRDDCNKRHEASERSRDP
jgi:hypothetical protein